MNTLIWAIILVVVLKAYAKQWLHWTVAAMLIVIVPYGIEVGAQAIALKVWDQDPSGAFAIFHPVTVALQLLVAVGVLYWLERREESLTDWAIGIGLLFFGLLFVAPYIATMLL